MPKAIVCLALVVCSLVLAVTTYSMGSRVPAVGMPASDFQLRDVAGRTHNLSDYRGKTVLLNFWATWCKPCTTEMPAMQACYEKLKDEGFVVIAVNELEDEAKVRAHVREQGHTFPVLLDPSNKVANQFGVFALPVSVFIDENGIVRQYIKGGILSEERIGNFVRQLKPGTQIGANQIGQYEK